MSHLETNSLRRVAIVSAGVALAAGMAGAQQPAPGSFVGAVLLTDDAPATAAFYSQVFGWNLERADDGGYAVHHRGRIIAGISPLQNAEEDIEESFWLVGLTVEDLDASLEAAETAGGRIYENAERVSEYGRFAVVADREGAPAMLIEPGRQPLGDTEGHGSWAWAELWTDDMAAAAGFYGPVVGVSHHEIARGDGSYHVFGSRGQARVGMVTIPDEFDDVEPGWAPYVAVADLAEVLETTERLGGAVVFSRTEHPAEGAVALIRDPSGAVLFLYQVGSHQESSK